MKILLTNDDGIDAPGLQALYDSISTHFGPQSIEMVVIAPDRGRSECSHSISGNDTLRVTEVRPGWYSVNGTPVECVRVALTELAPKTTHVFSGINAGANLGVDLMVSGTFAAAREAAIHHLPAMAISHYRRPDIPSTWDHVADWLAPVFSAYRERGMARERIAKDEIHAIWNVNLPAIDPDSDRPNIEYCPVDRKPISRVSFRDGESVRFESNFHERPRVHGTDVDRCFRGKLTISEIEPL